MQLVFWTPSNDTWLTHVFDDAAGTSAEHAAGWETYLNRLDTHLAGGYLSEEDLTSGGRTCTISTRSASG